MRSHSRENHLVAQEALWRQWTGRPTGRCLRPWAWRGRLRGHPVPGRREDGEVWLAAQRSGPGCGRHLCPAPRALLCLGFPLGGARGPGTGSAPVWASPRPSPGPSLGPQGCRTPLRSVVGGHRSLGRGWRAAAPSQPAWLPWTWELARLSEMAGPPSRVGGGPLTGDRATRPHVPSSQTPALRGRVPFVHGGPPDTRRAL